MAINLIDFPEEILERILALALAPTSSVWATPFDAAPHLLTRQPLLTAPESLHRDAQGLRTGTLRPPVSAYTPLLVCTHFQRIGTAVLYADVQLTSPAQVRLFLRTLNQRPDLAACVRRLSVGGVRSCVLDLIRVFAAGGDAPIRLASFDFCLDFMNIAPDTLGPDVDAFCLALQLLPTLGSVQHLTVRRAPNAYINLPGPTHILDTLGAIIEDWKSLKSVTIGFPLPGPPLKAATLRAATANLLHAPEQHAPPAPGGVVHQRRILDRMPGNRTRAACTQFALALGTAPSLKVVRLHIPTLWNTAFLEIANNPSLEAIVLTPRPATLGAHPFLMVARRHQRLYELIEAGNKLLPPLVPVRQNAFLHPEAAGRLRAHTVIGRSSPSAGPSFVASASTPTLPTIHVSRAAGANAPAGNAAAGGAGNGRLGVGPRTRQGRRNTIFA